MKSTTETQNDPTYFSDHILIATPSLNGSYFEKAVIYVYMHNVEGAMGVVINRSAPHMRYQDILTQLGLPESKIDIFPTIHLGGPLETTKGFVLHSNDYSSASTHQVGQTASFTSTIDILQDIATGKGPHKSLFALGYAGWGARQLEEEIQQDAWSLLPADSSLIFDVDDHQKWHHCANHLGIDFAHYMPVVGHS